MPKFETFSREELEGYINYHRGKGEMRTPAFIAALRELERKRRRPNEPILSFESSLRVILHAARQGKCICYKDLADANDAEWAKVRHTINYHLGDIIDHAHSRGWPMLSAIVVNKGNIETGKMDKETLKGFVKAARELGYNTGTDDELFLEREQKRVFAWAKEMPA